MNFFTRRIRIFLIGLFAVCIFCGAYYYKSSTHEYETAWGENIDIDGFEKVINSKIMQRLKSIDQSGPSRYLGPKLPHFSRYEHSLGVFEILKKAHASKGELVAGLLHDVSHTVFSHVGDFVFAENINDYSQKSYQDSIHIKYLKENNIEPILKHIGLSINDIDIDKNEYRALEQPLPDMCADRIQYNIHTGLILGRLSKKEAREILDNIKFENGKWFFENPQIAEKFADLSLYFTQNFWGSVWNASQNIHFSNVLKRALKIGIITQADLFSSDKIVMNKLIKNQDHEIQINMQQCRKPVDKIPGQSYKIEEFKPKFRGIDPLIKTSSGKFQRLSELNELFRSHYNAVKKWCKDGFDVFILDVNSDNKKSEE